MWGLWEWMLVGAIAALLFGHKVPSLARAMGLSVGSFKEGLAGGDDAPAIEEPPVDPSKPKALDYTPDR